MTKQPQEPKQTTREGMKIPVPKRKDLMADIRKLIKPAPKKT